MKHAPIVSPMATGNGAYVLHQMLNAHIPDYYVKGYHPYRTFFPLSLFCMAGLKNARMIHTTPDYGIFFYKKTVPLILTVHNYVLDRFMRPYSSFLQNIHYTTDLIWFTKMALEKAHTVTAVSHFAAQMLKKDLHFNKPVKVIYNGIDEDHFKPVSSKSSSKRVLVFFSGNLTSRKGIMWLPEIALKLNPNIHICYTQGLRTKKILPSLPNLIPTGAVPFMDMPYQYQKMDMLIMPTVREGFGLSVAEAMSCGLPVIASHCSSMPELVDHGKGGFLCPIGDIDAFASKINHLADSPAKRKEMGEYNRMKIESMFTLKRMIKDYMTLFESIETEVKTTCTNE